MSRIRSIELVRVELPLIRPFRTSLGEMTHKRCVLVRAETDEAEGWGECVADERPDFSGEFNDGVWAAIRDHLGPLAMDVEDADAARVELALRSLRGNPMAKAAVIDAVLDAQLRGRDESLAAWLGAERDRVACGVSIGIAATTEALLQEVEGYLAHGYVRIKLKIEPGLDLERVRAVRAAHPDILLSVDANAAYAPGDVDVFRSLETERLLMIEQPLHHEDLVQHAKLQARLTTPICLDESIRSAADVDAALELGSCRVVNVKQGRVGGVLEARRIHDRCRAAGIPVWCGGMLETGVGRAVNLALAAMPGFTLPGDTSASSRYFAEDLTEPFELAADGTMGVPTGPGIGVAPLPDRLEACASARAVVPAR
ncbi:MAG TPA: o-succinylbenzoate synthase [Actinomycetota bacterium]|nr:o-succinylbenzoate synthase [Actinomycetota bacterium]